MKPAYDGIRKVGMLGLLKVHHPLVLQRRIAKYDVLVFVLGCQRAIAVGSTHHVVRSKSAAKITLSDKPSL